MTPVQHSLATLRFLVNGVGADGINWNFPPSAFSGSTGEAETTGFVRALSDCQAG